MSFFLYFCLLLKKSFKILISSVLLTVVLFASVPKIYIHQLLGHHHNSEQKKSDVTSVSTDDETKDCTFEKFDTPVYYTVFKFISNFLPLQESSETSFYYQEDSLIKQKQVLSLLRAPPAA